MGLLVAEIVNLFNSDKFLISVLSSATDYIGSVIGFLAIYYRDNKSFYEGLPTNERLKKTLKSAFGLWPSIALADVAYIVVRPYFHYLLLTSGIEAGIAATIAHFLAFGAFNAIAIFSRGILDFVKMKKENNRVFGNI